MKRRNSWHKHENPKTCAIYTIVREAIGWRESDVVHAAVHEAVGLLHLGRVTVRFASGEEWTYIFDMKAKVADVLKDSGNLIVSEQVH